MSNPGIPPNKANLRLSGRQARRSLAAAQRSTFNSRINQNLLSSNLLRSAQSIAAYVAFDGEPDISPALHSFHGRGQQVSQPCIEAHNRSMQMHRWRPGMTMAKCELGVQQPTNVEPVSINDLDVILMPLVAWDNKGNRLGMGGGYYDRYLEAVMESRRPLRVGIAYDAQRTENIINQQHDIPLHALIHENGWVDFATRQAATTTDKKRG